MNPLRGLSFSLTYKQNIFENYALLADTNYFRPDLSFGLSLSVNDSLWHPIRYGAAYLEETHGGLYPRGAAVPSWGFRAGLDVVSNPIIFGVGLSAGVSWYFLDQTPTTGSIPATTLLSSTSGCATGFYERAGDLSIDYPCNAGPGRRPRAARRYNVAGHIGQRLLRGRGHTKQGERRSFGRKAAVPIFLPLTNPSLVDVLCKSVPRSSRVHASASLAAPCAPSSRASALRSTFSSI